MSKTIITISRQYGSGGRLIAQRLSEKLGVPFYDRALIEMAAKESGYEAELFENLGEQHNSNWFYNLSLFGNSTAMQDLPLNLFGTGQRHPQSRGRRQLCDRRALCRLCAA